MNRYIEPISIRAKVYSSCKKLLTAKASGWLVHGPLMILITLNTFILPILNPYPDSPLFNPDGIVRSIYNNIHFFYRYFIPKG
jgi:hypothetical protein